MKPRPPRGCSVMDAARKQNITNVRFRAAIIRSLKFEDKSYPYSYL
jgi:hypothetical protein